MNFSDCAYDIIILAGQSNAAGTGRGEVKEEYVPDENIISLSPVFDISRKIEDGIDKRWINYKDTLPVFEIAHERIAKEVKNGDLSLTFSKEYINNGYLNSGRKVLIIRAAIGATGFMHGHWGVGKPLYSKMVELVEYALSQNPENKLKVLLWHQGEHEVGKKNPPEKYFNELRNLFRDFKKRFDSENLPIISADFSHEWKHTKGAEGQAISNVIRKVVTGEGGIYLETDDLLSNNQKNGDKDIIHFCRESLYTLGKRYFEAYKKLQ
ncbi:MAG: sialate O-acetylesterase [Ruminococcaceae bacterium]|nr:sialate O-acetylesterase [Oscillospiraceae bacterium]